MATKYWRQKSELEGKNFSLLVINFHKLCTFIRQYTFTGLNSYYYLGLYVIFSFHQNSEKNFKRKIKDACITKKN